MNAEAPVNSSQHSVSGFSRRSTRPTILGCDELTVWRVDWQDDILSNPNPNPTHGYYDAHEPIVVVVRSHRLQTLI